MVNVPFLAITCRQNSHLVGTLHGTTWVTVQKIHIGLSVLLILQEHQKQFRNISIAQYSVVKGSLQYVHFGQTNKKKSLVY